MIGQPNTTFVLTQNQIAGLLMDFYLASTSNIIRVHLFADGQDVDLSDRVVAIADGGYVNAIVRVPKVNSLQY